VAKFASGGKQNNKKDLGLMAMTYKNVYVARIAMGYNDAQTLQAIQEAEAHNGPSLIIAYSHCINHGIDMVTKVEAPEGRRRIGAMVAVPLQPRSSWRKARTRSRSIPARRRSR
jgi:pyruvate/2-oxoacid:ferredoxin oxidoreductase beta subunit